MSVILAVERRDRQALADDPERAGLTAPLAGHPLTVVSADGTVLHAEVHGPDAGLTLVLVHGWMCTSATWHHQIRALAGPVRLVAYDQRGHVRSRPGAGGDYSAEALAADLDAVLDQTCSPR